MKRYSHSLRILLMWAVPFANRVNIQVRPWIRLRSRTNLSLNLQLEKATLVINIILNPLFLRTLIIFPFVFSDYDVDEQKSEIVRNSL